MLSLSKVLALKGFRPTYYILYHKIHSTDAEKYIDAVKYEMRFLNNNLIKK